MHWSDSIEETIKMRARIKAAEEWATIRQELIDALSRASVNQCSDDTVFGRRVREAIDTETPEYVVQHYERELRQRIVDDAMRTIDK